MASNKPNDCKISHCTIDEADDVVDFIKRHWKDDHIFVQSRELLNWQHADGHRLNFIIARHKETRRILGVLGFIPTSQYDASLKETFDTWGAIWKVTNDAPSGLGLALMQYFHEKLKPMSHGAISNTDIALGLYKLTNQQTGDLRHYFILSAAVGDYRIAKPANRSKTMAPVVAAVSVLQEMVLSPDIALSHRHRPRKSLTYLINRYQHHPVYHYRFFGAYTDGTLIAILVVRKQFKGTASCLRIVDMYGDIAGIGGLYHQLQELLTREESEYVDCLNHGIDEAQFRAMGFEKLDREDGTIIPNYFEPFERRNVTINFAIKSPYRDYVIFRGDGDQDRPSILPAG